MKKTNRTTLRRLAIAVPLLLLIAIGTHHVSKPPAARQDERAVGGDGAEKIAAASVAAPTAKVAGSATAPASQPATLPSQARGAEPPPPRTASAEWQPGNFAGVRVRFKPEEPKPAPPRGTPRTPLEFKPVKTASGVELLAARLDSTWEIPLRAAPAAGAKANQR